MADISATLSSKKDNWETPWWLVKALEKKLSVKGGFDLDPTATYSSKKANNYFDEAADGLRHDWYGEVFCNPPYSSIARWMKKGMVEASRGNASVTMLVAARTDTRWWWDCARFGRVYLIKGRIKFILPPPTVEEIDEFELTGKPLPESTSAPFPSAIVRFSTYLSEPPSTTYWDVRKEEGQ